VTLSFERRRQVPYRDARTCDLMLDIAGASSFRSLSIIDRRDPLERIAEAFKYVVTRVHEGKCRDHGGASWSHSIGFVSSG
jgi:hypothetical protein